MSGSCFTATEAVVFSLLLTQQSIHSINEAEGGIKGNVEVITVTGPGEGFHSASLLGLVSPIYSISCFYPVSTKPLAGLCGDVLPFLSVGPH